MLPEPQLWIGAPSPGGLSLPSAQPSAATLYGPRGVYLDDDHLIVADTGNHRVLIWHGLPTHDHAPASIVLGQPNFATEGPNARGLGPTRGLHMPSAVTIHNGNLVVADSWNHRILIYDGVPQTSYQPPALALGQPDLNSVELNSGGPRSASTFNWPFNFLFHNNRFYVTDTGNRRVLAWHNTPASNAPADFVLGQSDMLQGEENRGAPVSASSFRWPHAAVVCNNSLWIADAGNHRVLAFPDDISRDAPATSLLGQKNFASNSEFVLAPQSAESLRFPYGLASTEDWLAVADTANNRVLLWNAAPQINHSADFVLGQPDFHSNGENHWKSVAYNTLCWPYGLASHNNWLAVADSGNNRVMLWKVPTPAPRNRHSQPQEVSQCA